MVTGVAQFAFGLFTFAPDSGWASLLAAPIAIFLSGIACWLLAPWLARLVTSGINHSIPVNRLSLYSLYCTAFVSLGVWFALGNFAQMFNWLHYFITSYRPSSPPEFSSFYSLSQSAITFAAGVALVATAKVWARKLANAGQQTPASNH
jgi:hypothetical protein